MRWRLAHHADDLYGLAYNLAAPRVRFILPGGCETSSDHDPSPHDGDLRPLRATRQWFRWSPEDQSPEAIQQRLKTAATALAGCVREAHSKAPGAKLVLGGFSQGALVSLQAASAMVPKPAALVQLAAQAPGALTPSSLAGVKLLVAAGTRDPVAPLATAQRLLEACTAAGADAAPLVTFEGEHEVTMDAVHAVGEMLKGLRDEAAAVVEVA